MPKQIGSIDLKKSGYVLESKTQYAISNTGSAPAPSSIAWTDVMPTIAELSVDSTNKLYARQCNLINGTFVPGPPYDAHMLDGLALFTNTVANKDVNNNYTSINGSTITTGKIQDTSHKNFIQVAADSIYPAGHMEFKDTANWGDAHQGLQWDSAQGELNIKGNISANSLTIINGNDSYDGTAAINISGYDIEIVKDSVDVQEDVSVYLYPVLYHNGEKVPDYIQSADTSVDSSKTYYTRSGSAGSYVYTEVTNPSGNPSQIPYYEKQIDYSHFLWYQDDSEIGTAGDANNRGRYLATYGHNYRVTYDFDDGAVGGATEVQTRYVDPEKYITKVNDTEITIHPESYQNVSSYIRLGTSGLNIYNSSGNSIAQYGSTARVGLNDSSRFLMNNNSLQAYDDNNVKYFEVSSSGLTWGSQAAATTQQVSNLSSQLAGKANTSDVTQAVSDLEDAIDLKADSTDVPTSVTDLSDGANYSTTNQMNNAIGAAVVGKADIEDVPTSVTDLSDGADYSTTTQMNNAIGAAETRAAKTATNYISMVDNNGITIHSNDDNNERNILINSNEISIRNGLLPMMTLDNDSLDFNVVDVNAGTISSAATFGARTRIGRVDTGYSKILIDSTSIESGIANIFQIVAKNDTDVVDIILDDDHTSDSIEVNKALDNIYTNFSVDSLSSTSFSSASESYTMSEVASISEGNNFSLVIEVQCTTENWVQDITQNYSLFTFVKGTPSTETDSQDVIGRNNTKLGEYNLTVQYISPATFNITISAKKTTISYAPSSMNVSLYTLSYMSDLELVPIQRYNGDLLFNAVHGRAYLGLDVELADGEAVNGSDEGLYNSILSLGWQDTLGGIFLSSPNYIGIYGVINILAGDSVTIVAEVNYADTDIVWESSDTSVATVTPYEADSVIIRGVARGACEITVSTSFMDKVFSESLSVRVG